MPHFSDGEDYCCLCGQRVDEFKAEHRGEKPSSGGVRPCKFVAYKLAAEEAIEALIWCSGSPEFGPEGYARQGWERGPQKVLDQWKALKRLQQKE